jgi:hypothetical protein
MRRCRPSPEALGIPADGRADEVIVGVGQERHLTTAVAEELVRIVPVPVVADDGSEAQVFDPGAARGEEPRERNRFRPASERPAGHVRGLLERCAQVRRTEADDVADP